MMSNYIKGKAIGISSNNKIITKTANQADIKYDTITFYGGTGGVILDKVYGTNDVLTEDIIKEYSSASKQLYWGKNAYLMCWFENTLLGGNVSSIEDPITTWTIYRLNTITNEVIKLQDVTAAQSIYHDYTALKGQTYKYWIVGSNDTEISSPLISSEVNCDYEGWFVIDPERNTVFAFNLSQSGGEIRIEENVNEYVTSNRYNLFSRGKTEYASGTITALLYEELDEFKQSTEFLTKFKEFIMSDRLKYVKDKKGRIYKAFIYGYSESEFTQDKSVPLNITFSFKECGEVNENK